MKGSRLKKLREERGLNQIELANILHISASAIGMYETDKRDPSDELKMLIADFFDVSVDYLVGKTDIRKNTDLNNIRMASYNGVDIDGLSEKEIEEIRQFVEFVRNKNKK